ncbi:hypothetical protein [Mycoplasma leonicaptivi]|uniref:hypothetical protein n=1 Tax=Mycoplasma leonicaptivi TaxID=36742 RepID=UPI0004837161|nr:hypothetical protein [Mycoplasma leonicaptivi]
MNKKIKNKFSICFNIFFVLFSLIIFLINIPWKHILGLNYEILPIYAKILIYSFYTIINIILVVVLTYFKKYKPIHIQYIIFTIGVITTLGWLPSNVKIENSKQTQLQWYWYKYDTVVVFVIYTILYFLGIYLFKYENFEKIRNKINKNI